MSFFGKDPKEDAAKDDPKKRDEWEQNLRDAKARRESGAEHDPDVIPPEVVDQTKGEHRVVGSDVIGGDRRADDMGGVISPDQKPVHGYDHPEAAAKPGPMQTAPNPVDHGVGTVDREIAVTTGDHGQVVDVQEVDAGSKKGKGRK